MRKSKAEKRVLIAKDVLLSLKNGSFKPITRSFVTFKKGSSSPEEQVSTFLKDKKCNVCAVGALFCSAVKSFNRLKLKDVLSPDNWHRNSFFIDQFKEYLCKFFNRSQIRLIEIAFEINKGYYCASHNDTDQAAVLFGKRYPIQKTRMIGIMNNIIRNKGQFVLPKKLLDQARRKINKNKF